MQSRRALLVAGLTAMAVAIASAITWGVWMEPVVVGTSSKAHSADAAHAVTDLRDGATSAPQANRVEAPSIAEPKSEPKDDRYSRRLRIVDDIGAPLPGAEYFEGSLPRSSMLGMLEREAWQQYWRPDTWLASCTRQVADAGGYVDAHPGDTPGLYVARHEGRLGFADGFPFPDEVRVDAGRMCKVTVVDASAGPIPGAAVVLRRKDDPPNSRELIVGVTDANGICLVSNLARLRSEWPDWTPRLGVRGLGVRTADVNFDPATPPAEVTLTLPACGTIAIELVDPFGTRLSSPECIALFGPDSEELAEFARESGPVEFGLCVCGLQLCVGSLGNHPIVGPQRAGQRVVETLHLLDLEPGGRALVGRAVRADRTPIAGAVLWGRGGRYDTVVSTTTTAAGRFAFLYDEDHIRDLTRESRFAVVEPESREGHDSSYRRGAFVLLPDSRATGVFDLGDVVLLDAVVLARGCVRARHGPLPDASVSSTYFSRNVDPVTLGNGRFEVRGVPGTLAIAFEARAIGYATQTIAERVPCPDLDIVLEPEGRLEVELLVDREVKEYQWHVFTDLVDASGERWPTRSDSWQRRWNVRPGTYQCVVRLLESQEPLAVVSGIVVAQGSKPDGEPVRIDLRGRLRAVELDWVDEAGEPVVLDDPMLFAASRADGQQGEHLLDAVNGGVSSSIVLFSGAPTTIVVEDPNHTGSWSGPSSDRHVIMHSLPRTRFLVEGLPPAPAGSRWRICASAASGAANRVLNVGGQTGRRPGNWLRSEIDAEGRGELSLLARSRYEIELELTADNGRSRIELPATSGNVDTGEILPRELTFRFDAQKLQAAVH